MRKTKLPVLNVVIGRFALAERFKHQVVTSSAGCGKTTRLVEEYLARVRKGVSPSNLLAVTFTHLAASEMKERVIERFKEELEEEWRKFNRGELQLRISTIHSFLADLLARYSLDLDLSPGFEVVSGPFLEELWKESVDEELENLFLSGQAEIYQDILSTYGLSFLKRILGEAYSMRPATDIMAGEEVARVPFGRKPETAEGKFALLLYRVLERFQAKKKDLGVVDFSDLEILVLNFLKTYPDFNSLLLFFNEHFYHLLVDEFQDTSVTQWQIINSLVEEWLSGAGLREVFDSSLFLVGDAKQSIYRFRGAEVGIFKKVVEEFSVRAEKGGEDHYLPVEVEKYNRRSARKIIEFINWFFPFLVEESEVEDRFVYHDFLPTREEEGLVEAKFFLVPDQKSGSKDERVRKEAFWVAERIVDLLNSGVEIEYKGERRPLRFSDVAIIMRNTTHSSKFEEELKKRGLPYYVRKGKDFFRQPEVSFLVQALRFVANENDDFALFSLLRSPVFSFDLPSVFRVLKKRERFLWQKIQGEETFSSTVRVLKSWLGKRGKPPTEIADFVLSSSGAFSCFTLPSQNYNLEKFFLLLSQLELAGWSTVENIVDWLKKAEGEEESEAELPADESIRILTAHASKGLEFPVVFVVLIDDFGSGRDSKKWFYLNSDLKSFTFKAFVRKPQRKNDEFLNYLARKSLEEEKRLLYVAFTRARDFLFLTGGGKAKDVNNDKTIFGRLYQMINREKPELISKFEPGEKETTNFREGLRSTSLLPLAGKFREQSQFKKGEPVTKEIVLTSLVEEEKARYGEVFHRLLEWLSQQSGEGVKISRLLKEAKVLIESSHLNSSFKKRLWRELESLFLSGYLERIVLYQPGFEEKAFFSLEDNAYFERRFDKVLFKENEVWLVDYKTDEIGESELEEAVALYQRQLLAYKDLASALYPRKRIRAFLLFSSLPRLVEVGENRRSCKRKQSD